jgi:hypothetical protein
MADESKDEKDTTPRVGRVHQVSGTVKVSSGSSSGEHESDA